MMKLSRSQMLPLYPFLHLHRLRTPYPNPITNPLRPRPRTLPLLRILLRLRNLTSRIFRI